MKKGSYFISSPAFGISSFLDFREINTIRMHDILQWIIGLIHEIGVVLDDLAYVYIDSISLDSARRIKPL